MLDHVREQADDADADAEREAGGEQRQQRRQQRAEHDEQDHCRGEEPEQQAARVAALAGRLRDLPADLELDRVGRRRRDLVDERLGLGSWRPCWTAASNVTLANATSPLGEICALPAGVVRRRDRRDVRQLGDLREQRLGLGAGRGVGDLALAGADHQLVGVARGLRGVALQQPDRVEALRVRELEVVGVRAPDGTVDQRSRRRSRRSSQGPPGVCGQSKFLQVFAYEREPLCSAVNRPPATLCIRCLKNP